MSQRDPPDLLAPAAPPAEGTRAHAAADPLTDGAPAAQSEGVERPSAQAVRGEMPIGTPPPSGLTKKERDALFRHIYDREFTYVWHSLRRFGVWDRDLEDAAHDCFVVIHRRLDDYDRDRPLKPWLVGIAFRVASDFRRRAQHRREIVHDEVEAVDGRPGADTFVAERENREIVHEAMETLDSDRRAVFVLHELEGHPIPAVAEMLEVPLNTCYSRLRVARERFTAAVHRIQARRLNDATRREAATNAQRALKGGGTA